MYLFHVLETQMQREKEIVKRYHVHKTSSLIHNQVEVQTSHKSKVQITGWSITGGKQTEHEGVRTPV